MDFEKIIDKIVSFLILIFAVILLSISIFGLYKGDYVLVLYGALFSSIYWLRYFYPFK